MAMRFCFNVADDELKSRPAPSADHCEQQWGMGRELFDGFRQRVSGAEQGAMSIFTEDPTPVIEPQPVKAHAN
jgi:dihydroxyacid dehydratase/phosphogluconate dehydratase